MYSSMREQNLWTLTLTKPGGAFSNRCHPLLKTVLKLNIHYSQDVHFTNNEIQSLYTYKFCVIQ